MASIEPARSSEINILNVGYNSTNYYLVGQNSTQLLIDVGWPGTLPKLLNIFKRKRIHPRSIKYLIATHYHPDHAGLSQEVKMLGVMLVVLDNQQPFISNLRKYMKPSNPYLEIAAVDNFNLSFKDSREFLLGLGIEGEIIPTPGHSDDGISLILDKGIAFTGDLPGPCWGEDTLHQVEQSWQRIKAMGAEIIYPGHGPVRHLECQNII